MDEFVEMLLENEMALEISLPHLDKRHVLEARGELSPRISILEDELNEIIKETEKEESESTKREKGQDSSVEPESKKVEIASCSVCNKHNMFDDRTLLTAFPSDIPPRGSKGL